MCICFCKAILRNKNKKYDSLITVFETFGMYLDMQTQFKVVENVYGRKSMLLKEKQYETFKLKESVLFLLKLLLL